MSPDNQKTIRNISLIAGLSSIFLLCLHYYYYCHTAFAEWGLTNSLADQISLRLTRSNLFKHRPANQLLILVAGLISVIGTRHSSQSNKRQLIRRTAIGIALYFGSNLMLVSVTHLQLRVVLYIASSLTGLTMLYTAARSIAGILSIRFSTADIFNRYNESFPQEERLITAPNSIHLRAKYKFRNQTRNSWINLVDIYRGTLIMGKPGSGKTRYLIRPFIRQSLKQGMALFVYDLKYDDLTRFTYHLLKSINPTLEKPLAFFSVNCDDPSRSHRLNLLDPKDLHEISDAAESSRTTLYALNRRWVHQQGEFFVESAINFFTANIWFLREYEGGRYCTLPHAVELIQIDFGKLLSVLRSYPQTESIVNSFVSAYENNTVEQLQGQIDSARIALASLSSPIIYYILSGNDFRLDLNNPQYPKVICLGSNPQKQYIYGAIVSLMVNRMTKLVNRQGAHPCHLIYDEFSSFYEGSMSYTLANARSNKVAITLGIQDLSQLRKEYGRDHADALFNLPGNLISGQVTGDSASLVSQQFGRTLQEKQTTSTNSRDTSTSQSFHLDHAMPASKIAALSSGEFVGFTADSPTHPLPLKGFHCAIQPDTLADQEFPPIPELRTVTNETIDLNFRQIKEDVRTLVDARLATMLATPSLSRLVLLRKTNTPGQRQSPS